MKLLIERIAPGHTQHQFIDNLGFLDLRFKMNAGVLAFKAAHNPAENGCSAGKDPDAQPVLSGRIQLLIEPVPVHHLRRSGVSVRKLFLPYGVDPARISTENSIPDQVRVPRRKCCFRLNQVLTDQEIPEMIRILLHPVQDHKFFFGDPACQIPLAVIGNIL